MTALALAPDTVRNVVECGGGSRPPAVAPPAIRPGGTFEVTPRMAAGGFVDLKLGHYSKDGIEVVNVEGEIDIYTAPRLRELLIDLARRRTTTSSSSIWRRSGSSTPPAWGCWSAA